MKKPIYILLIGLLFGPTLNTAMQRKTLEERQSMILRDNKDHVIEEFKKKSIESCRSKWADYCDICDTCCQLCNRPAFLPLTATILSIFAFACWANKSNS